MLSELCPDCSAPVNAPQRPALAHGGMPVWCAFCEHSERPKIELKQSVMEAAFPLLAAVNDMLERISIRPKK